MTRDSWQTVAAKQGGVISRAQLNAAGVDRWAIRHRLRIRRWIAHTPLVIGTTTGPLTREAMMWIGTLHGGEQAVVGDLSAAEVAGLQNWTREEVTILVPHGKRCGDGFPGIRFRTTRRPLSDLNVRIKGLPVCRLEPAVLMFAARQTSRRTAAGVLAAVVQQRLTTPDRLLQWLDEMEPLRGAARCRAALADIAGGAQSVAEIDVRRMCRAAGLALPARQVKRRDATGRVRFTDCEWRFVDGRVLVLEVDGGFHMDADQWEDDLARQRALSGQDRVIVRCTARELRDDPDRVAHDLRVLGVPAA